MSYEDPVINQPAQMPVMMAAALQDHLMMAATDLERLQRLLDDACDALIEGFHSSAGQLSRVIDRGHEITPELQEVRHKLFKAVTALQFQDMATQLIAHTNLRLQSCADQIARDALGAEDSDGVAVAADLQIRANPVTQDEMDAGSVELF